MLSLQKRAAAAPEGFWGVLFKQKNLLCSSHLLPSFDKHPAIQSTNGGDNIRRCVRRACGGLDRRVLKKQPNCETGIFKGPFVKGRPNGAGLQPRPHTARRGCRGRTDPVGRPAPGSTHRSIDVVQVRRSSVRGSSNLLTKHLSQHATLSQAVGAPVQTPQHGHCYICNGCLSCHCPLACYFSS